MWDLNNEEGRSIIRNSKESLTEMTSDTAAPDPESLRAERDLLLQILELGRQSEIESFLKGALDLIVKTTGAEIGFIEIRDPSEADTAWALASGCDDLELEQIKKRISRGIIAEALLSGETVETDSAQLDERFAKRASVKRRRIDAVLCTSIGGDAAAGVVYLQGHSGFGPFETADRNTIELFAYHLVPLVDRILIRHRTLETSDAMLDLRRKYHLEEIVGRSPALAKAVEQAMLAAPLDINVMLRGSSGTGKTQLAKAIHRNSGRSTGPFVEVNCAALPDTLIESELFGAVAGSHSEARTDRIGKVAAAEGGTLFLDEIGELPKPAQAKLLQLLHSREYYPLGATRPRFADIRVIAATNLDLEAEIERQRFREDLYFRLQVLPIELPELSRRRTDLPELAKKLLERACKEHALPDLELSREAIVAIEMADWPGNVRELQNRIGAGSIRAIGERSPRLRAHHLFPDVEAPNDEAAGRQGAGMSFHDATRQFQRHLLRETLIESDWNVREVAHQLDLARSHVYNLIKVFEIER